MRADLRLKQFFIKTRTVVFCHTGFDFFLMLNKFKIAFDKNKNTTLFYKF